MTTSIKLKCDWKDCIQVFETNKFVKKSEGEYEAKKEGWSIGKIDYHKNAVVSSSKFNPKHEIFALCPKHTADIVVNINTYDLAKEVK